MRQASMERDESLGFAPIISHSRLAQGLPKSDMKTVLNKCSERKKFQLLNFFMKSVLLFSKQISIN